MKEDNINCPITRQPMRHPVLASDGTHYELKAIMDYLKGDPKSPKIRTEIITTLTYDLALKNSIDELEKSNGLDDERYSDYDKKEFIKESEFSISLLGSSNRSQLNFFRQQLSHVHLAQQPQISSENKALEALKVGIISLFISNVILGAYYIYENGEYRPRDFLAYTAPISAFAGIADYCNYSLQRFTFNSSVLLRQAFDLIKYITPEPIKEVASRTVNFVRR